MKNTFKTVVLLCLMACMLLTTVACNAVIAPNETGTGSETTDAATPEGTTPEETTAPEETTFPEETTVPDETTAPDETTDPEEKFTYMIKVSDTDNHPIAGVGLVLCLGDTRVALPATEANGYTKYVSAIAQNYTARVISADGYQFDATLDYPFVSGSDGNVAYITLAPISMPEVIDMQGYTYKAYVRDFVGDSLDAQIAYGNNAYRCIDFWVDEANSENDIISYSVYNRNQQIEHDYNCKIKQVSSNGSQIEYLLAAFQDCDGYDLTIMTAKPAAHAATMDLLQNLKGREYIDLSNPSFDQNSVKDLSVMDKLYFLSGDMNISTLEVAGATVVNMQFYENISNAIVEAFDGDETYRNIYNVVSDRKWTMDTMLKIATKANIDINKDDGDDLSFINKGDTVGYHQYLYSALWYFYGSGGRITTQSEDGFPEFIIQVPSNQELYTYLFEKFNRQVGVNTWIPHESSNILNMNFLTGQVLFADMSFFNIRNEIYPKAEFEYGILPLPVYEEGMDYQSVVYFNNWAHLWAIPQMVQNQEYAERMMEIMAVYSSLPDSTMSAYYDRTIYLQASKDNGSREVMDTIRTSLVYDMALLYPSWGGIESRLYQIAVATQAEYTNIVESLLRVEESMRATVDMLLNPSGE